MLTNINTMKTSAGLRTFCSLTMAAVLCCLQSPKTADAQVNIDPNRRYDQNVYLTAHNSYANAEQDYIKLTADQRRSVTAQLDQGCTCLMPDVYLMRQHPRTLGGFKAEIYFGNDTHVRDTDFQNDPLEITVAHNPTSAVGGYALLSGYPIDWPRFRSFREYLLEVRSWMDAHPRVVVTLVLESYVSDPIIMQQTFVAAGLANRVFFADRSNLNFPSPDGPDWDVRMWGWPTLKQMADNGRTLVVFSSMGVQSNQATDGLPYQWDSMVENVYGDDSLNPATSSGARSESKQLDNALQPLFFMNYFPTFNTFGPDYQGTDVPSTGVWNYSRLNSATSLKNAVAHNSQAAARFPNFIAVNFYDTGARSIESYLSGPTEAAYFFNNQWGILPYVVARISGQTPNGDGWYNRKGSINLTGTAAYPNGNPAKVIGVQFNVATKDTLYHVLAAAPHKIDLAEGILSGTFCAISDDHSSRSNTIGFSLKVDFTPPETTLALAEAPNAAGWFKSDVHAQLTATDNVSGVKATYFGIGSGFQRYVAPLVLSEGENTIQYYSEDFASNQEHVKKQNVRIDKTPPATTASFSPAPNTDGWNNTDVQVRLQGRDNLSGVATTVYRTGLFPIPYSAPFSVSSEGSTTVTFYSFDKADNKEQDRTATVRIDKRAPVTTPTVTGEIGLGRPAQINLAASDDRSGVKSVNFRLDGSTTHSAPTDQVHFQVSSVGQHTVEFWSVDKAGNNESHQTITITIQAIARDVSNLIAITRGGYTRVGNTNTFAQRVTLKNISNQSITGPISLTLNALSQGAVLLNKSGVTAATNPAGSPYIDSAVATLEPGDSITVVLQIDNPSLGTINYIPRVLAGQGVR